MHTSPFQRDVYDVVASRGCYWSPPLNSESAGGSRPWLGAWTRGWGLGPGRPRLQAWGAGLWGPETRAYPYGLDLGLRLQGAPRGRGGGPRLREAWTLGPELGGARDPAAWNLGPWAQVASIVIQRLI